MNDATFGVDDWVALFREAGMDDDAMHTWHARFESRFPQAHQSFLEWLGVSAREIERIRTSSQTTWTA